MPVIQKFTELCIRLNENEENIGNETVLRNLVVGQMFFWCPALEKKGIDGTSTTVCFRSYLVSE